MLRVSKPSFLFSLYALHAFATDSIATTVIVLDRWPEVRSQNIEDAVDVADAAFLATVEFLDPQKDERNRLEAGLRLHVVRSIWGKPPADVIELPRRFFPRENYGNDRDPWDKMEKPSRPVVLLTSGRGERMSVHFVVLAEGLDELPHIKQLQTIRNWERREEEAARVRERLTDAIVDPESRQLLWSYALRQLYLLADDPARRFEIVLNPRIQEKAPMPAGYDGSANSSLGRLNYASNLLMGLVGPELLPEQSVKPEELRVVLGGLLDAFETAPSPYMAETALGYFVESQETVRKAGLTEQQWDHIRQKVRHCVDDPGHPIHQIRPDIRRKANGILETLLGKPELLGANRFSHIVSYVEEAIRESDSAYYGDLEWYEVERPNPNLLNASGRIHPVRPVWGSFPGESLNIGRNYFLVWGGSRVTTIWDVVPPNHEGRRIPIVLFSRGLGADREFLFVIGPGDANLVPPVHELLLVQSLESKKDSPQLRDELIQLVLNEGSSEVLWKYSLRRLYRLENDPIRRFELILGPPLQDMTFVPRLRYAGGLLTGLEIADPENYRRIQAVEGGGKYIVWVTRDEAREVLLKLLRVIETTSNPQLIPIALSGFLGNAAHNGQFTDREWSEIRRRVNTALDKEDHPSHQLSPDNQDYVLQLRNGINREPNPFSALPSNQQGD